MSELVSYSKAEFRARIVKIIADFDVFREAADHWPLAAEKIADKIEVVVKQAYDLGWHDASESID